MGSNIFFRFFLFMQIVGIGIDLPETLAFFAVNIFSVTFLALALFTVDNVSMYFFFPQFLGKLIPLEFKCVFHINSWLLSCKALRFVFLFARTISRNR